MAQLSLAPDSMASASCGVGACQECVSGAALLLASAAPAGVAAVAMAAASASRLSIAATAVSVGAAAMAALQAASWASAAPGALLRWRQSGGAGGVDRETVHATIALASLGMWARMMARVLARERRRYLSRHVQKSGSFRTYLTYRFGHWYAWTSESSIILLCGLSATLLVLGGLLHSVFAAVSISDSLWAAWIWIAAPDGGNSAQPGGYAVGMLVSIGGMLIFALLVSIITSEFENALWHLRHGSLPVVEGDHIVILGWTAETTVLIEELSIGLESRGGGLIVLLALQPKPDIEKRISDSEIDLRNSSVVVRSGDARTREDLKRVAVQTARRILVLADKDVPRERADSQTLNILLALEGLERLNPQQCVVVECCLIRNQHLFYTLKNGPMEVLTIQDFLGQLLVESSRQRGMSHIINDLMGFAGDEFYIAKVEGLRGMTFKQILYAFPEVVPIGYIPAESEATGEFTVKLVPPMDYTFQGTERLVLLAEDASTVPAAAPADSPACAGGAKGSRLKQIRESTGLYPRCGFVLGRPEQGTELVVIIGWNEAMDSIVSDLDSHLSRGSRVIIYSPCPSAEREEFLASSQKRRKHIYANFSVEHWEGAMGSRYKLDELPLDKASKIFMLADSTCASASEADSATVGTLLQVRDILLERSDGSDLGALALIPQVLGKMGEEACIFSGLHDCVNSTKLRARVLASVCETPELCNVFGELLSETSTSLCIRRLSDYTTGHGSEEVELSFRDIMELAAAAGEVAIGCRSWEPNTSPQQWVLNPKEKGERRLWSPSDYDIVVIARLRKHAPSLAERIKSTSLMPRLRLSTQVVKRACSFPAAGAGAGDGAAKGTADHGRPELRRKPSLLPFALPRTADAGGAGSGCRAAVARERFQSDPGEHRPPGPEPGQASCPNSPLITPCSWSQAGAAPSEVPESGGGDTATSPSCMLDAGGDLGTRSEPVEYMHWERMFTM